jgi:hypothetical protein
MVVKRVNMVCFCDPSGELSRLLVFVPSSWSWMHSEGLDGVLLSSMAGVQTHDAEKKSLYGCLQLPHHPDRLRYCRVENVRTHDAEKRGRTSSSQHWAFLAFTSGRA